MKKNLFSICAIALLGAVAVTSCKDSDDLTNERLEREQAVAKCEGEIAILADELDDLEDEVVALAADLENVKATYAKKSELEAAVKELEAKINAAKEAAINASKEYTDGQIEELKDELDGILKELKSDLEKQINDAKKELEELINEIKDALGNYVTGIQVNEVYNNAFGAYTDLLTDVQTNIMIGYYGTHSVEGGLWPTTVKLGRLNLTVNPLERDATGLQLALINSLGKESKIKLSDAIAADKALVAGVTRAEKNDANTYYTFASIDIEDIETIKLDLSKTNLMQSANEALKATTRPTLSTFANMVYDLVKVTNIERLAVKAKFENKINGETVSCNTQSSSYDVNVVAVKPFGFNAVQAFGRPLFDAGKAAMEKLVKLVGKVALDTAKELYPSLKPGIKNIIIRGIDKANKVVLITCDCGTAGKHEFTVKLPENFSETELVNQFIAETKAVYRSKSFQDALDQIGRKIGAGIEKLIQPELFVYSETGFCRAGVPGDPTYVKGDKVLFYASSYSAELLVPIAKKELMHDGKDLYDEYAKKFEAEHGYPLDPLAPIELSLADFDPNEGDGYHTIEYIATDYTGAKFTQTFAVTFCK